MQRKLQTSFNVFCGSILRAAGTLYDSKTTIASNRSNAYQVEQLIINQNGKAGNVSKNFNKINSPGAKLLKKIGKFIP